MTPDWNHLRELALDEVERTLDDLPEPLRAEARELPITLERRPSRARQGDGIAADTLGLFVGPDYADRDVSASPIPPQIILYLENLWEQAEGEDEFFLDEVHTTLLHELGHYLGLDEEGLSERGLE